MNTCLSKNEVYFMEGIEISYIKILQKALIENKSSIFFPCSEKNISFLFFLSGQGMLKINAFGGMNKYKISSNYYITVPPCNDILEYIAEKNTDILKFDVSPFFIFNKIKKISEIEVIPYFFKIFKNLKRTILVKNIEEDIIPILYQITNSTISNNLYRLGSSIKVLMYIFHGIYKNNKISSIDIQRIENVKKILRKNIESPPTFHALAAEAKMDLVRFTKSFRMVTGTTPYGYLRIKRLEHAMYLLSEKKMSVTDATYAVGYSNPSYFAKIFYEHYKIMPSDVRLSPDM